ncbi:MAG: OsmC family protein [Actinobacteria bacterium]|nr:OsmC family protein [Actinomycetota bacterium]
MTSKQTVDPAAIEATVAAIKEQPDLANVSFSVHSDWTGGFCASSATGDLTQAGSVDPTRDISFKLESDEPPALLGEDKAPSAGDYVLKALAACYSVTLAANAAVRGIELDSVHFDLEGDFDLHGFLGMDESVRPGMQELRVDVSIESPNASREQLEELVQAVQERSPIRDTLAAPVSVVTTLT